MKILESNEFDNAIASGVVLVDFYADWCGPCKMLAPVIEGLADKMTNVSFYKLNVDNSSDIARRYGVQAIPNLIIFKDGKAVEYDAEVNKDLLRDLLNIDEGASYLGECALIAHDSPINNTGILFLNTLYDENASCHLAVGRGFTNTIKDYEKYSKEELHNFGINDSSSHVDFMIGTKDMKIVGKTIDDKEVVIFENGNWAFN